MSPVSKFALKSSLAAGLLLSFMAPASATLIVNTGPGPGGDNALANTCPGYTGAAGTTVMGCLNSNNATDVIFQSTSNTVQENLVYSGGQATLSAATGSALIKSQEWGFNNATISLGGGLVFSFIRLSIDAFEDGQVQFFDSFGESSGLIALDSSGEQKFELSSSLGDLSWIRIETGNRNVVYDKKNNLSVTDGNMADIKQVRFDGVSNPNCTENCGGPPPAIPEPATLFLMGSALLGYGASRRRKKSA